MQYNYNVSARFHIRETVCWSAGVKTKQCECLVPEYSRNIWQLSVCSCKNIHIMDIIIIKFQPIWIGRLWIFTIGKLKSSRACNFSIRLLVIWMSWWFLFSNYYCSYFSLCLGFQVAFSFDTIITRSDNKWWSCVDCMFTTSMSFTKYNSYNISVKFRHGSCGELSQLSGNQNLKVKQDFESKTRLKFHHLFTVIHQINNEYFMIVFLHWRCLI